MKWVKVGNKMKKMNDLMVVHCKKQMQNYFRGTCTFSTTKYKYIAFRDRLDIFDLC